MESLRRFRENLQRLAARAVGQDTRPPRHTTGMMRWAGMENDVLRMPVDEVASMFLQDDSGAFLFVTDDSSADGADPIQ
jgi:hypothetical protein